MPDDFDPYHVWLGIPPEEQPANYYRLLGIRPFETNPDVIESAADRQMAHLRTFQGGTHSNLSQRLLNELATARICLLNSAKKVAYDQQLRAAMPKSAPATGGSKVGMSAAGNLPVAQALPAAAPVAPTQSTSVWDELIGNPGAKTPTLGGNSGRLAAGGKRKSNSLAYVGGGIGLMLAAAVGVVLFVLNSDSDARLTFDWPASDRAGATLTVDDQPVAIPASGPWDYRCPPGEHRIVAMRPAFKSEETVSLTKGQQQTIAPQWKPKAVLVVNWPLAERQGAVLLVDNHAQSLSPREPLELPVEPGRHVIQIKRSDSEPYEASVSIASDQRQIVAVPSAQAILVFDWPADQRSEAKLDIDDQPAAIDASAATLDFHLRPGRHTIRLTRPDFQPFEQVVTLTSGANKAIVPAWTALPMKPKPDSSASEITGEPKPPGKTPPSETASDTIAPQTKKLPVPSTAEQAKVAKQLDEVFKVAHSADKDRALAEDLFKTAEDSGNSAAERYMLLMKGVGLAAGIGDLDLAWRGIDQLDAGYEIDSLGAKQKLLDEALKNAASAEQIAALVAAAESFVDQAIAADHYDVALAVAATAAKAIAKRAADVQLRKQTEEWIIHRRGDIAALQTAWAVAKTAQTTLEKNADDAPASLVLGRWHSLYKGDWDRGLPLLVKGSDERLKALANQELAAALEPKQQAEAADGWWEFAQKETGLPRDGARTHAGDLYRLALPNLESPLKKAAIEQRLAEIAALHQRPLTSSLPRNAAIHSLLPKGAVLLFTFDKDNFFQRDGKSFVKDLSGKGNDGAVNGAKTVEGQAREALSFSSGGDYVECKHSNSLDLTKSLTACAWIKARSWEKGNHVLGNPGNIDGEHGYHFKVPNAEVLFTIGNSGWFDAKAEQRIELGKWYHIAATYDGNKVEMFVDGKSTGSTDVGGISPSPSNFRIGQTVLSREQGGFDGEVDEVAVFSRVLTDAEIQSVYQLGLKGQSLAGIEKRTAGALDPQITKPHPRQLDLLKLLDLEKDSVKGKWQMKDGGLLSGAEVLSRVEFPYEPPEEYDFEIAFTRIENNDIVSQICSARGHQFEWCMGNIGGTNSQFQKIEQQEDNPTKSKMGLGTNQRHTSLVKVRRGGVQAYVDGRLAAQWMTNYDDMHLVEGYEFRNPTTLALVTWKTPTIFHYARVIEVTGVGKVLPRP